MENSLWSLALPYYVFIKCLQSIATRIACIALTRAHNFKSKTSQWRRSQGLGKNAISKFLERDCCRAGRSFRFQPIELGAIIIIIIMPRELPLEKKRFKFFVKKNLKIIYVLCYLLIGKFPLYAKASLKDQNLLFFRDCAVYSSTRIPYLTLLY